MARTVTQRWLVSKYCNGWLLTSLVVNLHGFPTPADLITQRLLDLEMAFAFTMALARHGLMTTLPGQASHTFLNVENQYDQSISHTVTCFRQRLALWCIVLVTHECTSEQHILQDSIYSERTPFEQCRNVAISV